MTLRVDPGRSIVRRTLLAGIAALLVPLPALAQTATKEKVAAALPKLEEFARQVVDKKLVPGLSIAVVHRDEVVLLDAFGVRQIGKPATVDADTVFQLASVSKPLSSTVVSALVSDGKVSWDSRIRDIDPGFALQDELAAANVTIGDLFAHRSGLPGHVGDDIEELGFTQGEILQRLRLAKPAYSFRNGYSYSNFGLTEGAVAAARVSGRSWEEAAEEKLYKPLGMNSTSSRYRDFMNQANRAALHVPVDGELGLLHPAQCRCAGARRRRELECTRHGAMAAPPAGQRAVRRPPGDREGRRCSRRMFPRSCAASIRRRAPRPSTVSAGTSIIASMASNGVMPARSAPGRARSCT